MTASNPDRLDRIEELLTGFGEDFNALREQSAKTNEKVESLGHLGEDLSTVKNDLNSLKEQTTKTNERVEIYQKASQQVVNLAFGLILTAALAIIIPVVTNR